jgi:hypothetical protein
VVRKTTSIISGKNEKEKFFAKFPHSPRPLSDFWGRRVRKGGKDVEKRGSFCYYNNVLSMPAKKLGG